MAGKKTKQNISLVSSPSAWSGVWPLWRQRCRNYRVLTCQYDTEAGEDVQNARPPPCVRFALNSCQRGVKNGGLFTAGS